MTARYDVVVVGAGLVGLATAHHLIQFNPACRIAVVDAATEVGSEQSSRNSGVVHAGVYYPPGSKKALLCVAGRAQLRAFCETYDVPYVVNGKLIVALDGRERDALGELERRATANNVPVERLGPDGLRSYEPRVRGIAALYSPSTAITDFGVVAKRLADTLRDRHVELHTGTRVTRITQDAAGAHVASTTGTFITDRVIVAAGLNADRVAKASGLTLNERIVPFRGSWLRLADALRDIVTHNIYPVPVGNGLPFLGVHVTRRPNGELWVGPNAVLMATRSGTKRYGVNRRDLLDAVTFPGLWRLGQRHLATGVGEVSRDVSRRLMTRALNRYLPDVQPGDLTDGPFGIRAQLLGRNGELIDDFRLLTDRRVTHVLNAPSPAATASFAIGEELARGVITAH